MKQVYKGEATIDILLDRAIKISIVLTSLSVFGLVVYSIAIA